MADARGFFQNSRMPDGFFRANQSTGIAIISAAVGMIYNVHPTQPGNNYGVGHYVPDPASATLTELCLIYENFVNQLVVPLYPNPTGVLLDALNANLDNLFSPLAAHNCTQVFPYGQ